MPLADALAVEGLVAAALEDMPGIHLRLSVANDVKHGRYLSSDIAVIIP